MAKLTKKERESIQADTKKGHTAKELVDGYGITEKQALFYINKYGSPAQAEQVLEAGMKIADEMIANQYPTEVIGFNPGTEGEVVKKTTSATKHGPVNYSQEIKVGQYYNPRGWATFWEVVEVTDTEVMIRKDPDRGWVEDSRTMKREMFLRYFIQCEKPSLTITEAKSE